MSGRWKIACFMFGLTCGLWVSTFINMLWPLASFALAYTLCIPTLWLVASARRPARNPAHAKRRNE